MSNMCNDNFLIIKLSTDLLVKKISKFVIIITNMKTQKTLKVVFRIISVMLLIIAIISLLILFFQILRFLYYKNGDIWRPLLNFSFIGLGVIGAYALWKFEKWAVVIYGINFINVLIAQSFKLTYLGTCCSTTPNRAATSILLSGGILLLVYLSRRYLEGVYFKRLPIFLFLVFLILNQISLTRLLGVW